MQPWQVTTCSFASHLIFDLTWFLTDMFMSPRQTKKGEEEAEMLGWQDKMEALRERIKNDIFSCVFIIAL